MYDYLIHEGDFTVEEETFVFNGKMVQVTDAITSKDTTAPMFGEVHFSDALTEGEYGFDIIFKGVNENTRCGLLFGYENSNGTVKTYQVSLRNGLGAYGLDRFDGRKWDFLISCGPNDVLKANQEYSIQIEIRGNTLKVFINKVPAFEYTMLPYL